MLSRDVESSELKILHVVPQVSVKAGGLPLAVFEIANSTSQFGVSSTILSTTAMSGSPRDTSNVIMS